ncbi:hypothetical protein BKI52_28560 [marine bacterium AO1-C]|nr:hypothetical protein BKI52_28560 [marine bacterium AO1-C]
MAQFKLKNIFTRKRVIRFTLLLFVLALVGFVFTLSTPKVVALKQTKVVKLEGKTMHLMAEVEVHNANYFPITLREIQSQIFINDQPVALSQKSDKLVLASRSNTTVELDVTLDVKSLAKIYAALQKQDECEVTVKGSYALKTLVSTFKLRNSNTQTINLKDNRDQISKFTIGKEGLKVQNLKTSSGLGGMNISMKLGLKNEHPFDYKINYLDVDITPANNSSKLGHWRLPRQKVIHAHTLEYLPVKFQIASDKLLSALSVIYSKKVKAVGVCQVVIAGEVFDIPIKQAISLPAHQLVSSQF